MIAGVILAAGRSARLGRPKQLLPLDGLPILEHVLRRAAQSRLDEIVVVLGHDAATIAVAVGNHGQKVVINPDYAAGQSTSLRAGLHAIDREAAAVLVLLGDQPEVEPAAIGAVIEAYRCGRGSIVIAAYHGRRGHPVLFDRSFFPRLAEMTGDEGARRLLRDMPDSVFEVAIDTLPLPPDIDTEEDYAALQKRWQNTIETRSGS